VRASRSLRSALRGRLAAERARLGFGTFLSASRLTRRPRASVLKLYVMQAEPNYAQPWQARVILWRCVVARASARALECVSVR
jgi:hypothetical protein